MSSLITSGRAVVDIVRYDQILSASKTGRSGQLLSLVTAGAPEGGLSGGCQGAILSSRRLNLQRKFLSFSFKNPEAQAAPFRELFSRP